MLSLSRPHFRSSSTFTDAYGRFTAAEWALWRGKCAIQFASRNLPPSPRHTNCAWVWWVYAFHNVTVINEKTHNRNSYSVGCFFSLFRRYTAICTAPHSRNMCNDCWEQIGNQFTHIVLQNDKNIDERGREERTAPVNASDAFKVDDRNSNLTLRCEISINYCLFLSTDQQ